MCFSRFGRILAGVARRGSELEGEAHGTHHGRAHTVSDTAYGRGVLFEELFWNCPGNLTGRKHLGFGNDITGFHMSLKARAYRKKGMAHLVDVFAARSAA